MVRAKLTRTDGSTLELEGTSEEVAAVLAWEVCSSAKVEARLVISPKPPPTPMSSHGRTITPI